jgi:membrane protease YdiL (CAAX protease family)
VSVERVELEAAGSRTRRAADGLVVLVGLTFLLTRPVLLGGGPSPVPLAVAWVALLALSVGAGAPADERRASMAWVVGVGVAAVAAARLWAAPGIPAPVSATAVAMNTLAAVAEEAFFRGFLYGRLARFGPAVAVVATAAVFAAVHVPVYGTAALWVDFGAGLLLGWQRWASGGWGAPAVTHAAANLAAMVP